MRIFINRWFARFAVKEGITNGELREMANQLESGQSANRRPRTAGFDADLGGGVYKIRVARSGKGKSGGYRVIVFFKSGEQTFFVYGYAKSSRENLSRKELKTYKDAAKEYLSMNTDELKERIEHGQFVELLE